MPSSIPRTRFWHDPSYSPLSPTSAPQTRVVWASIPWKGRLGRYVALRQTGDLLEVGVACAPRLTWVAADEAMSPQQLERWLKGGFRQR